MAGNFSYKAQGDDSIKSADAAHQQSFCEGRTAQIQGVDTNPHPEGTPYFIAWQDGHDTVTPEGLVDGCCYAIPITVPTLTGMTLEDAQNAILSINLAVGQITGSSGTVITQNPTPGIKVQPQITIDFTITE